MGSCQHPRPWVQLGPRHLADTNQTNKTGVTLLVAFAVLFVPLHWGHTHVLVYVLLSQLNAEPCVLDGCWKHLFSFSKFLVHDLAHSPMPIILQHIRFTFWILWNHGSWEFNRKLLNCISLLYFIWKYYPFQAFFLMPFFFRQLRQSSL